MQSALARGSADEPRTISVGADPSGIVYARGMLYVADAYSGAIHQVAGARQRRIATIETGGVIANDRIGGIAVASHGILYVSRLGHGQAGAIIRVERDGRMRTLPQLPACWWRSGIVYDACEPALYTTQYMTSQSGGFVGGIVEIDLVSGEPSLVLDGFQQPIGIAKLGAMLVVTDARQRAVFRVEIAAGRAVRRFQLTSYLGRPAGICAFDEDSVIVTAFDDQTRSGEVRRIWLDGQTERIATGPWDPSGVASDGSWVWVSTRRSGRVLAFQL
jgi:hypothetical protein